jgi:cytochrome c oxidase assembly protein subunit 11
MTAERAQANGKTARRLAVVVLAMFGFGYALVPLYDVLCELTGLGGRTGVVEASALAGGVDTSRSIKVQFLGTVSSRLPWEFRPNVASMEVHPGQVYETTYFARNLSSATTIGQARPSVAPSIASLHFNKTECFCFVEQEFAPGEARSMPVRFVLSRDIPAEIATVTLSYTFFNSRQAG